MLVITNILIEVIFVRNVRLDTYVGILMGGRKDVTFGKGGF